MNGDYAIKSFQAECNKEGIRLIYHLEGKGDSGILCHNLTFREALNLGSVLKQWGMERSQ